MIAGVCATPKPYAAAELYLHEETSFSKEELVKHVILVALVALGIAAAAQAAPTKGAGVTVRSTQYGKVLFTSAGKALYVFEADKGTTSHCYGACAKAWPPLLTKGAPVAGKGIDHMLLGVAMRKNGAHQVTYKGHPLYRYSGDPIGKAKCQHVNANGGLWLVIAPNGRVNMSKAK
ncbi:MAG: COG4315 family predicted lipoprotein [Gaiellaceae bacterium]